jgi:hypothetical protein
VVGEGCCGRAIGRDCAAIGIHRRRYRRKAVERGDALTAGLLAGDVEGRSCRRSRWR